MLRLLLGGTTIRISTRLVYVVWTRVSALALLLWASTTTIAVPGTAEVALALILILLLVGGGVLLVVGIRDLIRDLRKSVQTGSNKDGHAAA